MIYTGTCSWTDKSLIRTDEFYPKEINTAEARLRYYASNFNTVEVDSSYYAIPDRRTAWLWAERTPEDFTFHIKAYGALTGHGINPKSLPKDILSLIPVAEKEKKYVYLKEHDTLQVIAQKFIDSLSPLHEAGKLGVIVFQYPPWFHYRTSNLDYILTSKELMQDLTVAVEFRHGSWLKQDRVESVFDFLREHKLTYITADEPQYDSLATIPFIPQLTSDIAYFRLHGRNKENWLKKGIETSLRYDYFYSDDELKGFLELVIKANKDTKETYVMFNNCHGASGVRNALRLKELITSC